LHHYVTSVHIKKESRLVSFIACEEVGLEMHTCMSKEKHKHVCVNVFDIECGGDL